LSKVSGGTWKGQILICGGQHLHLCEGSTGLFWEWVLLLLSGGVLLLFSGVISWVCCLGVVLFLLGVALVWRSVVGHGVGLLDAVAVVSMIVVVGLGAEG